MAAKTKIAVLQSNCSGCLRCALACSFFTSTERLFNPSRSRINVLPRFDQGGFDIEIGEECDCCGICVAYCEFGALEMEEGLP